MTRQMKNLNLTSRLAAALEAYCKRVGLAESDVVRRAVEEYLKAKGENLG